MGKQLWELGVDAITKDIVHLLCNENCCIGTALKILDRAKEELLKQPCFVPSNDDEE